MTKSTSEPIVQPANLDKEAGGGMRLLEGPYKKRLPSLLFCFLFLLFIRMDYPTFKRFIET